MLLPHVARLAGMTMLWCLVRTALVATPPLVPAQPSDVCQFTASGQTRPREQRQPGLGGAHTQD